MLRCARNDDEAELLYHHVSHSVYETILTISSLRAQRSNPEKWSSKLIMNSIATKTLTAAKTNLLGLDPANMREYFVELGEPAYRGTQMVKWLHQQRIIDFQQMTNFSQSLRARLADIATVWIPKVISRQLSQDGTCKWLLQLNAGNCIETVYIPEKDRGTLCVSSQVGCALNCSFCATGAQGFNRDLSVAEIIAQVWIAKQEFKVTNVVLMGMGEPLLNFANVVDALNLMLDDNAYGLSKYRVTLSTSGIVPAMKQLAKVSEVALAVSLHAPNDELRNELVPINKKYPLKELMNVCRDYFVDSKRKITMEYVMLAGVNDTQQHAQQLVRLLQGVPAKVNLIPFNPYQFARYQCSTPEAIAAFQSILAAGGLTTIVRRPRGDDIAAACGQLAGDFQDRTKRRQRNMATWSEEQA